MQVYSVVGADIAPGKNQESWDWAIKLAEYINTNRAGSQLEVIQDVTGRGNRITWVSKHDSLGDAEESREWYEADAGFQKLIDESIEEELIDWSTLDRTYFRIRS